MRFSISRCSSRGLVLHPLSPRLVLITLIVVMGPGLCGAAHAVSGWFVSPEIRVSGGEESDLLIDPELTPTVVPGGPFAELSPAISASRWFGASTFVDLRTFATIQRFMNDQSRLLYAHTVRGSAFRDCSDSVRGRLSVTADYFDDSERKWVRRLGIGSELGAAFLSRQWNLELWGGGGRRTYPDLTIQEKHDQEVAYDETTWRGGTILRVSAGKDIDVAAEGVVERTDSRDPFFDSKSWMVRGDVNTRLMASLVLALSGTYQERDFVERSPGEEKDEYWQMGVGLRYDLAPGWIASVRWGHSRYTWPGGETEDSRRLAVGIEHRWGRRSAVPPPSIDAEALIAGGGGSIQRAERDDTIILRVRAVGAEKVTVAGTFNGWNPETAPLLSIGDGWWEIHMKLEPGLYEYVYVVDGVWTTPPEAAVTVSDGFGGYNGILEILPSDL
jgi:hypothetical protein